MEIAFQFKDSYFLQWNGDAVRTLRFIYRIVGQPIGSLSNYPLQTRQLALPVVYTSEQVRYLCDNGLATAYEISTTSFTSPKPNSISETLPLEGEPENICRVPYIWPELSTDSYLKCRYLAFCRLVNSGLYVSSGHRFGGDWMVYHDDPASVHAVIVVTCLESSFPVNEVNVVQTCATNRVAESCRKKLIYSFLKNDNLSFIPFGWAIEDGRSDVTTSGGWNENDEEMDLLKKIYNKINLLPDNN